MKILASMTASAAAIVITSFAASDRAAADNGYADYAAYRQYCSVEDYRRRYPDYCAQFAYDYAYRPAYTYNYGYGYPYAYGGYYPYRYGYRAYYPYRGRYGYSSWRYRNWGYGPRYRGRRW